MSVVRDRDDALYRGLFADPERSGREIVRDPHMPLDPSGALAPPTQ